MDWGHWLVLGLKVLGVRVVRFGGLCVAGLSSICNAAHYRWLGGIGLCWDCKFSMLGSCAAAGLRIAGLSGIYDEAHYRRPPGGIGKRWNGWFYVAMWLCLGAAPWRAGQPPTTTS